MLVKRIPVFGVAREVVGIEGVLGDAEMGKEGKGRGDVDRQPVERIAGHEGLAWQKIAVN